MNLKLIHGEGEIKRLSKQVKDAFDIINGNTIEGFKHRTKLVDKIERLGFVSTSSSGVTFIGKTQVIKCALITRRPPPISYRVPTLIYAYNNIRPTEWDWNFVVCIQPRVDMRWNNRIGDYRTHMKRFEKLSNCDTHSGNIGRYKGEVVLFDW